MSKNIPTHKEPSELVEAFKEVVQFARLTFNYLRPSFTKSADSELKAGVTYYIQNTKKLLDAEYKTFGKLDFEPDTVRLAGKSHDGFPLLELKSEDGKQNFLMQTDWRGKKLSPIELGLTLGKNQNFKHETYFVVSDANTFMKNITQILDNGRNKELELVIRDDDLSEASSNQITVNNKDRLAYEGEDTNGNWVFRFTGTAGLKDIEILVKASPKHTPETLGLTPDKLDISLNNAIAIAQAYAGPRRY